MFTLHKTTSVPCHAIHFGDDQNEEKIEKVKFIKISYKKLVIQKNKPAFGLKLLKDNDLFCFNKFQFFSHNYVKSTFSDGMNYIGIMFKNTNL